MRQRPIRFLPLDVVLQLHAIAIEDQRGEPGIRDRGLLESALAAPQQVSGGSRLHGVPEMAAAYGFHICRNHPFVDGNKRTALAAMAAFLEDNGWAFEPPENELEQTMVGVAAGSIDESALITWVRRYTYEKPSLELREVLGELTRARLTEFAEALERGTDPEYEATIAEAAEAIPLVRERLEAAQAARDSGDELSAAAAAAQAHLLILIYRLAEDMGYEW